MAYATLIYDFGDIVTRLDEIRDDVRLSEYSHGKPIDIYELAKEIDILAQEAHGLHIENINRIEELNDESRDAYDWQNRYLEMLLHAEEHIQWLENEFHEEIVKEDKYERSDGI